APVAVPEATLYLDDQPMLAKDDVWTSRQSWVVQPETVAKTMQRAPNGELGFRVLGANPRHHLGTLFWSEYVRHGLQTLTFPQPSKLSFEPFEDGPLIIQRRAPNLLEEFDPRWLRKRGVLQAFVAIRAFGAEVSKFRLAAFGEVHDATDGEP